MHPPMSFWSGPPQTPPPPETPFFQVLWEVGGGGGVKNVEQMAPFFWVENHESFGFFSILSRKSHSGSRLHGVCMGRRGTSVGAVYAYSSHFCNVGGFGDLSDPVVPTLRGVSGDVVIVYAY